MLHTHANGTPPFLRHGAVLPSYLLSSYVYLSVYNCCAVCAPLCYYMCYGRSGRDLQVQGIAPWGPIHRQAKQKQAPTLALSAKNATLFSSTYQRFSQKHACKIEVRGVIRDA